MRSDGCANGQSECIGEGPVELAWVHRGRGRRWGSVFTYPTGERRMGTPTALGLSREILVLPPPLRVLAPLV